MTAFDGYFEPPASFNDLSGVQNQDGYYEPLFAFTNFQSFGNTLSTLSVIGTTFYFLTARCSIGPTTLFWVDRQISTVNAPVCAGSLSGLSVLGIFRA